MLCYRHLAKSLAAPNYANAGRQAQTSELQQELKAACAQLDDKQRQLAAAQEQVQQLDGPDGLAQQLQHAQQDVAAAQQQLQQLQQELTAAQEQAAAGDEAQRELQAAGEQVAQMQRELEEAQQQAAELKQQADRAEQLEAELADALQQLQQTRRNEQAAREAAEAAQQASVAETQVGWGDRGRIGETIWRLSMFSPRHGHLCCNQLCSNIRVALFQIEASYSTRQEELTASQAALDAALAEGRQQRQLLQQREAEAVELARVVEEARRGVAQVCTFRGSRDRRLQAALTISCGLGCAPDWDIDYSSAGKAHRTLQRD